MSTIATLLAMHKPAACEDSMVYSVWEDGEVTLEKGGELFGMRTLHSIIPSVGEGLSPKIFPVPNSQGTHGRIFVDTREEAETARAIIQAILR